MFGPISSSRLDVRRSLRRQVVLAILLIGLFTTIFMGAGVGAFVYQTERSAWEGRQREIAINAARSVESFLGQVHSYIALIGSMDRDYLSEHPQLISDLLGQNQALLEIILIDQDGNIFASAYQIDEPVLSNLFTIPQSNWFIHARQGQTYVSDLQISANNQPYLILAQPTPDGGVVAARLRMSVLWEVVSGLQFGSTGHAYVVNHQGEIIAHTDRGIVLARTNILERPEMQAALSAPGHVWAGIYRNFQNHEVVGSTQAIYFTENQAHPHEDWIILTEVAEQEAFATTRQAMVVLVGITAIFSILATLGTSHVMQRIILRPIAQLRQGTKRIGSGELDYRIAIQRQDEIGQVSNDFNEMAALLQQRESALAQTRDQALAANSFKSRLLANVSHDLKTPLSAIIGYADILTEQIYGPINERQRGAIQRILANTERLRNLISSLLDQAQIEAGRIALQREAFDPAELLSGIEAVLGVLAQKQGLALSTDIDSRLPSPLMGDPRRIHQILMNLVENAIKFTRSGSVLIRFFPQDGYWAMQVADTGCGIPEEDQARIFEPFQQVDNSTTREKIGVGLGLSIVMQLTSLMDGKINLESEPGRGSTFTVYLPLEIAVEENASEKETI
ncbi:MAG: sensor histidine kinase [Anaerolineales bacterium]|nr:sensor histidine kinase [Anaerolineales bacterium]